MDRCSKCLSVQYCSQECVVKDWEKFHKKVCDKWARDENRQMPEGGEQIKAMKKHAKAVNEKCTRQDCDNRGQILCCERCRAVAYCSQNCLQLHLTDHKEVCDDAVRRREEEERGKEVD